MRTTHFPSREAWAEHEFSKHRLRTWWDCPECVKKLSSAIEWEQHLDRDHQRKFSAAMLKVALEMARSAQYSSVEKEECPLCRVTVGNSRRLFVKHVGRHMEEIALMALPRDAEDENSEGSSNSGVISRSQMQSPVLSPLTAPRSLARYTVPRKLATDLHLSDIVKPIPSPSKGKRRWDLRSHEYTVSKGLPSAPASFYCLDPDCKKTFKRSFN